MEFNSTISSINSMHQVSALAALNDKEIIRPSTERVSKIESNVVWWILIDGFLLIVIFSGNILTILAIRLSRKLRSITSNLFVLSLAISDIFVGFTLPYHLAFYMGSGLGNSYYWCLLRFFLIIIACCVSIWNLIAIAVDRYIAILYPFHYVRYITRRVALTLISIGWFLGILIALIPMFWNNYDTAAECEFDEVLPPWYMAGIVTPLFSMVWICMLVLYSRIWLEASKQAKQMRTSFSGLNESSNSSDWKSVQMVLLILGCFSICWLPYFIIACAQIFKFLEGGSPTVYKAVFSMAIANSGMNPIIYAWKNSNFRQAFCYLLKCKNPNSHEIHNQIQKIHMQNRTHSTTTTMAMDKRDCNSTSIVNIKIPYDDDSDEKLSINYHQINKNSNVRRNMIENDYINMMEKSITSSSPPSQQRTTLRSTDKSIKDSLTSTSSFDSTTLPASSNCITYNNNLKHHSTGNLIVNNFECAEIENQNNLLKENVNQRLCYEHFAPKNSLECIFNENKVTIICNKVSK